MRRSIPALMFRDPVNAEIPALAYQLWKDRACPIGSPDEDWFLAEAELTNQKRVSAVAA